MGGEVICQQSRSLCGERNPPTGTLRLGRVVNQSAGRGDNGALHSQSRGFRWEIGDFHVLDLQTGQFPGPKSASRGQVNVNIERVRSRFGESLDLLRGKELGRVIDYAGSSAVRGSLGGKLHVIGGVHGDSGVHDGLGEDGSHDHVVVPDRGNRLLGGVQFPYPFRNLTLG